MVISYRTQYQSLLFTWMIHFFFIWIHFVRQHFFKFPKMSLFSLKIIICRVANIMEYTFWSQNENSMILFRIFPTARQMSWSLFFFMLCFIDCHYNRNTCTNHRRVWIETTCLSFDRFHSPLLFISLEFL